MNKDYKELLLAARKARENSYCPYSGFAVGAALLTEDGKIYTGANIENASYTPTVCAERVAFFTAIHNGEKKFNAIAISGGKAGNEPASAFYPCGVCRQVISEFCDENFVVIVDSPNGAITLTMNELYPYGFTKEQM